jgi:hypothetical protein
VVALIGRTHLLTAAAIASAICCCGCSGRLAQGALVPVAEATTEGTTLVPILVATKRKRSTADAGEMFNGERADEVSCGGAHSRAFEKLTSVMEMIEQRLAEGQQMSDGASKPDAASQ